MEGLDGIICVDMLGEGFDLPELKIAALHSPHRSLAVTLQFVGRFARTNSPHIGRAAFVANVSEMEIEREKLFSETAIWGEIIPALSDARINREIETSRVLASFSTRDPRERNVDSAAFSDVSLHSLQPYQHAKIYALGDDASVDLAGALDVGPDTAVVYHRITTDGACIVVIVERHSLPEWTSNTLFAGMTYDLIVIYHDRKARLLFIHTSDRNDGFFESLAKRCITGRIRPISLSRLNKVLIGLVNPEFFNIGMRNRVLSSTTETYRIVTGSDAGRVVQQSDGRLYQRGHFFGRAEEDGKRVTLGLSSMAKVWSNSYKRLPDLMAWFRKIADKLTSPETPQTFSGLDYLSTGREVNTLPPDIIAASWDRDVYDSGLELEWRSANETSSRAMLVDGDVRIAFDRSTADTIAVDIVFDDFEFQLTFSLKTDRFFRPLPRQ